MEDTLDNLGRRIDDDATPNLTNSFIHLGLHSYYWGIGTSTLSIKSLHLHLFSSGRHILHVYRVQSKRKEVSAVVKAAIRQMLTISEK